MTTRRIAIDVPEKVLLAEKTDERAFAKELHMLAAVSSTSSAVCRPGGPPNSPEWPASSSSCRSVATVSSLWMRSWRIWNGGTAEIAGDECTDERSQRADHRGRRSTRVRRRADRRVPPHGRLTGGVRGSRRHRAAVRENAAGETVPGEVVHAILDGTPPLRAWRRHRRLTLGGLAARVGVTKGYLSQIENGSPVPLTSAGSRLRWA